MYLLTYLLRTSRENWPAPILSLFDLCNILCGHLSNSWALVKTLHQGRNQEFILRMFFSPLFLPSLPSFPFFRLPSFLPFPFWAFSLWSKVAALIQLEVWVSAVSSPSVDWGKTLAQVYTDMAVLLGLGRLTAGNNNWSPHLLLLAWVRHLSGPGTTPMCRHLLNCCIYSSETSISAVCSSCGAWVTCVGEEKTPSTQNEA